MGLDQKQQTTMRITLFSHLDALRPFADDWDHLAAGNPFRSWTWNSAWWEAYGNQGPKDKQRLWTIGVLDHQNRLRGLAPWYQYSSATKGTVVSFLGSGDVCSEYQGIMAAPGDETAVIDLITDFLLDPTSGTTSGMPESYRRRWGRWDLLHFDGINNEDPLMNRFAERIQEESSLRFKRRTGMPCWRMEFTSDEETFLTSKSKSFRRRFRRYRKEFLETEAFRMKLPENVEELDIHHNALIDLHQRRRQSLGESGCYASSRFKEFHQNVLPALFRMGQATIPILFHNDTPIAASYQLLGNGIIYAYQCGIDPEYSEWRPGDLFHGEQVHRYIKQGVLALDFLRGDETYKQRWQAGPRVTSIWYVAAPHWSARCRDLFRRVGEEAKAVAKQKLRLIRSK